MKIAVCLFILCFGLIPADFAEGQTNVTDVGQIVKHIDEVALDKKERVIQLENQRESGLLNLIKSSHMEISNLVKASNNNKYANLKLKALAAQNVTLSRAHLILNLINKTIDGLRKSLQETGETVTELTKLYLLEVKDYADKCMKQMISAVKENNITAAKNIYKNELLFISKITEASNSRIRELVRICSKSVSNFEHSSGVLVLDTADKQVQKLEPLKADNEKLKKYIAFALDKITDLAKQSADKYKELVNVSLKRLKELESKSQQALTTLTQLEIKTATETIEKNTKPEHIIQPKTPILNGTCVNNDDKYEKEFNDYMKQINNNTMKLMLDTTKIFVELQQVRQEL